MKKLDKTNITITQEMEEVTVGMLLGDAWLNKSSKSANIIFCQKDKEFIDNLYGIFSPLVQTGPKLRKHSNKKYNRTYSSYRFGTLTFPYFTEIYPHWYIRVNGRNKKVIPCNISELLTPRSLAYWIMCDGHFDKRDEIIRISTDSFLPNDVMLLQSVLEDKFGIESKMHSNGYKDQYRIYIPHKYTLCLINYIEDYIIKSMHYKIGKDIII